MQAYWVRLLTLQCSATRDTLAAGATEKRPLQNQFYGDRSGTLTDPSGHVWTLATHVEDVTPEECHRRFEALLNSQGAAA